LERKLANEYISGRCLTGSGALIRNTDAGTEMTLMRWGMPPPPKFGGPPVTNIRTTSSPHWRGKSLSLLDTPNLLPIETGLSDGLNRSGATATIRARSTFCHG
jgi:hypothetical protein